jgi:hypothetical protein
LYLSKHPSIRDAPEHRTAAPYSRTSDHGAILLCVSVPWSSPDDESRRFFAFSCSSLALHGSPSAKCGDEDRKDRTTLSVGLPRHYSEKWLQEAPLGWQSCRRFGSNICFADHDCVRWRLGRKHRPTPCHHQPTGKPDGSSRTNCDLQCNCHRHWTAHLSVVRQWHCYQRRYLQFLHHPRSGEHR